MTGSETVEIHRALVRPYYAVVIVLLACVLACANPTTSGQMEDGLGAGPDSRVVSVDAPIAIGFFPLVEPVEWDGEAELAAEHFSFAISDLSTCLEDSDVAVEVFEAKAL